MRVEDLTTAIRSPAPRGLTSLRPARPASAKDRRGPATIGAIVVVTLTLLAGTALGQPNYIQPDETLPGFRAQNVLESRGLDNISPFNGDLGIVMPLGPQYTLSASSTWQLNAYYSAKLWRMDAGLCEGDLGVRHAYVRGDPTIGVGWTLSLGYRGPSSSGDGVHDGYFGPDGGFHETGDDGSHIRLLPGTNPPTVEFPDGSRHTFGQQYDAPSPSPPPGAGKSRDFTELNWQAMTFNIPTTRHGLTQIEDSARNVVLIAHYDTSHPWEITSVDLPTLGQSITFSWGNFTANGVTWQVVQYIDFPVFGPSPRRRVAFQYQSSTFPRNGYDNSSGVSEQICPNRSPGIGLPVLSSITFSDTSSSFAYSYTMSYFTQGDGAVERQGALQQITLPMGGFITYTYDSTAIACQCPPESSSTADVPVAPSAPKTTEWQNFLDKSIAVATRCESAGTSPCPASATVAYTRKNLVLSCYPVPCEGYDWDPYRVLRRVDVVAPGNDSGGTSQFLTRYYFHVAAFTDSSYMDAGLELERRHYDGATTSSNLVRDIISCWFPVSPGDGGGCGYHPGSDPNPYFRSSFSDLPPKQREVTWYTLAPPGDGGTCPSGSTPCKAIAHGSMPADYDANARCEERF